uniref:Uncharacterized protein n=1 Tax=Helianthus annuus TaxID=4232 RepID=A0A251U8A3_HELAN
MENLQEKIFHCIKWMAKISHTCHLHELFVQNLTLENLCKLPSNEHLRFSL